MAGLRIHTVMPQELVERVDAAASSLAVSRGEFVRRAVERRLAAEGSEPVHHFSWLAGFIDGEGCFMIAKSTGSLGAYRFQMSIRLRNDDRRILQELQELVGAGIVLTDIVRTDRSAAPNAKPQALWAISSKADISKIISIIDDHPLRTKKARDYAIWREAAQIWLAAPKGASADWPAIGVLCEKLAAVRGYECDGLDAEQALGSSEVRVGVRGRVPALPPAEQPRSEGVMEFDGKGRMKRFEGTYAPQVRSSSEARPFRPVPKKGEK